MTQHTHEFKFSPEEIVKEATELPGEIVNTLASMVVVHDHPDSNKVHHHSDLAELKSSESSKPVDKQRSGIWQDDKA